MKTHEISTEDYDKISQLEENRVELEQQRDNAKSQACIRILKLINNRIGVQLNETTKMYVRLYSYSIEITLTHESTHSIELKMQERGIEIYSTFRFDVDSPVGYDALTTFIYLTNALKEKGSDSELIISEFNKVKDLNNRISNLSSDICMSRRELQQKTDDAICASICSNIEIGKTYKLNVCGFNGKVEFPSANYKVESILGKTLTVTYYDRNKKQKNSYWSYGVNVTKRMPKSVFTEMVLKSVSQRARTIVETTLDASGLMEAITVQ
jgi:hypothetical protein